MKKNIYFLKKKDFSVFFPFSFLQNCRVFRSAEFFATDHRLVDASLKLHMKSRKPPRCNHTVFHLEKLKDLTCAHEYAVTVSNRFGVLDTLEDPEELWHTFKLGTLEAAKECIRGPPKVKEWLHLGRDAGKY